MDFGELSGVRSRLNAMSIDRTELHELIDALPDDEVASLLADARRRAHQPPRKLHEPFAWVAMGPSRHDRTDDARRVDEILAEGFGRD